MNKEIEYLGSLPNAPRRAKVEWKPWQSRCFKQPYRVHGVNGIHPALQSEEPQGR